MYITRQGTTNNVRHFHWDQHRVYIKEKKRKRKTTRSKDETKVVVDEDIIKKKIY